MKQIGLAIALAFCLAGCTPSTSNPTSSPAATTVPDPSPQASQSPVATQSPTVSEELLIKPGDGFGPINVSSTKESLAAEFGSENVKEEDIYVGEGFSLAGLVVYPDDEEKRVEVLWWEEDPTRVQMIRIQGASSQWKTSEGLSLGASLTDLERLNGKPFTMFGLGWDYGGSVSNWDGGKLEGLNVRMDAPTDAVFTDEETSQIMGDQEVASDNPVMQKVNPEVFQITVGFPLASDQG